MELRLKTIVSTDPFSTNMGFSFYEGWKRKIWRGNNDDETLRREKLVTIEGRCKHTPFSSHTCGRIIPPCLNYPTWWDRVGVIKTPPSTFAPLGFYNDLSSLSMMAWWDGIPLIIHRSSSSRRGCKQYMPMVTSLNSYIFSSFTLISKFALPSMVALWSKTTLLAKFTLPSRYLITWIKGQGEVCLVGGNRL